MHLFRTGLRPAVVLLLVVVGFTAGIGGPAPLRAQEGLRYENYDVNITVNEDGSFAVTAAQTVRFDDAYSTAFAEIPTDRVTGIRDVRVSQRDAATYLLTPLPFTVSDGLGKQTVEWEYDEVQAGDARTFVLEYTVEGGLWIYADRDYVRWFAVNADRSGLPVENATVSVTLPAAAAGSVSAEVVSGNGVGAAVENRALLRASGPLADGEPLEIEVGFAHGVVQAVRQPWQQADDAANVRVAIAQVDVGVTVQYDGRLDVTEESSVTVEQGVLEQGSRSIRLLYMDAIRDIRVMQDGRWLALGQEGCTECFVVRQQPGAYDWAHFAADSGEVVVDEEGAGLVDIDWYGAPVAAGETSLITLQYAIIGGVRAGSDAQVIHLEVLPDHDATTAHASLRIVPPPRVAADALLVDSAAATGPAEPQADGAVIFHNWELPASRARWEVVVTMPPGATSALTPAWQGQFVQAVAAQATATAAAARRTVVARTAALAAGAAALAAGLWLWFRYGRKRVRAQLNGYVAEPPSELAPGIVAYLMDRNASERGVVASLLQLATAGLVEIDLTSGVQLRRKGANAVTPGQRFATSGGGTVTLAHHQTILFNDVVLPHAPVDHFVDLDALAGPLRVRLPNLYAQMGEDAQDYFLADNGFAGRLAGCLSPTLLFPAAAVALGALLLSRTPSAWAILFVIGGFAFATVILVLALGRPFGRRRSASGDAEAERWVRFRNYLVNLAHYGDLGAAQEILDRHFAYAVSLGVENVVLSQAEEMGAALPQWMALPTHFPVDASTSSGPTGDGWPHADLGPRPVATAAAATTVHGAASGPSHSGARPSLSGMSRSMGESLAGASRKMGATLSAAAGATAATVVLRSQVKDRTLQWGAESNPTQMLDEIMRLSLRDADNIRNRPAQSGPRSPGWGGPGLGGGSSRSTWGSGSARSSGSSRSSGGFGSSARSSLARSTSSRRSSSSSRGSSSSSSSARGSSAPGGGRSGFGKK